MLKSILMGGAMLLAIPAFAQTTGSGNSGTTTTTGTSADNSEPMEADDQGTTATGTATTGTHSGHTGTGTMGTGTTGTGTMGTGTMGTGTMGTTATGTTAGAGGPFQAVSSYPPCTRTRTDSCRQRGGR
ncbi:MAG: hypothetical protein ACXWU6_08620 [Allosphingosinicella sp.]